MITMVRLKSAVYGAGPDRASLTPRTTRLAVASLILWAAAITAGRFMAYL